MLIYILCFCFLSSGIYLLLCDMLHIPTLASSQAAMEIARGGKAKVWKTDTLLMALASKLSPYIKLNPQQKKNLAASLLYAGINMQPETYLANAIIKLLLKMLLLIPFTVTLPAMDLVVIWWAVNSFFADIGSAQKMVKEKREQIERELPRFVETIEQQLHSNRNILVILIGYKSIAGEAFRNELELTIADMQSGIPEQALVRMEARVNSIMMSEIVRGLLAVMRGDNGVMHFSMLAIDFKKQERQQLNMIAVKRPDGLKVFNYLVLAGFFITLVVPIAMYLMDLLHQMAG
ncbi:hypothetical protein [Faecalispora sporosphaeroides]|uniref:hypothetical protein n=1 Tax=Faecalispora sporosphaeroides TaxID=1549 RepID=UPI00035F8443|nr:hypothetical protein [Faecalispora sporosphaeroides]